LVLKRLDFNMMYFFLKECPDLIPSSWDWGTWTIMIHSIICIYERRSWWHGPGSDPYCTHMKKRKLRARIMKRELVGWVDSILWSIMNALLPWYIVTYVEMAYSLITLKNSIFWWFSVVRVKRVLILDICPFCQIQ
jgi:hypothetical protein